MSSLLRFITEAILLVVLAAAVVVIVGAQQRADDLVRVSRMGDCDPDAPIVRMDQADLDAWRRVCQR